MRSRRARLRFTSRTSVCATVVLPSRIFQRTVNSVLTVCVSSGGRRKQVEAGAAIFTDELKSYEGLEKDFQHRVINHAVEYADGMVHTNTMENFWSLLKRGLHGTYSSVEPFHLFRYLDEQAYRYNNRKVTDAERFSGVMSQIVGKRLTYQELTGKTEEGPRQETVN